MKSVEITKVLTVKLEPSSEQWRRLRDLAWQSMRYRNQFVRALWAEMVGLRVDPEAGRKDTATKRARNEQKEELSGAAYSAAESEVETAINRDAKRMLAGAPLPQWRQTDSLAIRGHKKREKSGVRIDCIEGKFSAALQVQNKDCVDGCWITVKIASGTSRDEWQAPMLQLMASGELAILKGVVVFKKNRGKTLLRLAYSRDVTLPLPGERVATIGPVGEDRRFIVRSERSTLDCTSMLTLIMKRKDDWDSIRRRMAAQIGRARGAAREKRRQFMRTSMDDWLHTHVHQWTAKIVRWAVGQGVGKVTVLDLAGGDWPAYKFMQQLTYKCKEVGISVVDEAAASMKDEATTRAIEATVKKSQKKNRSLGDAVRTLARQLA